MAWDQHRSVTWKVVLPERMKSAQQTNPCSVTLCFWGQKRQKNKTVLKRPSASGVSAVAIYRSYSHITTNTGGQTIPNTIIASSLTLVPTTTNIVFVCSPLGQSDCVLYAHCQKCSVVRKTAPRWRLVKNWTTFHELSYDEKKIYLVGFLILDARVQWQY